MEEYSWRSHVDLLGGAARVIASTTRTHAGRPVAGAPLSWMDAPNEIERQLRGMLLDSVRLQLAAGANHLDGLGALLRAGGPSNAFFVVVRSVLDALGPAWWMLSPGTHLSVPGGVGTTAPVDPAVTMRTTVARLLCYLAADARQYRDVLIALHGSNTDPGLQERFDRYEHLAEVVAPNAIGRAPTHQEWTIDGQRWPRFTQMAGSLCEVLDQPAPARNPYKFLSGLSHVHPTFLMSGSTLLEQDLTARVRTLTFTPRPEVVDRWCRYAARAVYAVALAVYGAHGWPNESIHDWYEGWRALPMP